MQLFLMCECETKKTQKKMKINEKKIKRDEKMNKNEHPNTFCKTDKGKLKYIYKIKKKHNNK